MKAETEVMVAVPPWKAEFMEKKRKKAAKTDEVPKWKRELLKRIQSKNQRMIEEQPQADILEEHIPKVSDNIFLIHEKKHQHRFQSTPAPKTVTPETSPTATVTVAVDNVIIIEKESKDIDDVKLSNEADSVFVTNGEEKEYPKAGIVHRLMGRFQAEKSASTKKRVQYQPAPFQRSKSSEQIKPTSFTSPPPTPHSTPIEDKLSPDFVSPEHTRSYTMPSDMLSPLLVSSAKPFSKQNAEHGYHHVRMPIRKVSAATSPKSPTLANQEPQALKKSDTESSSVTATKSSFTDDLSKLHSNREVLPPPIPIQETIVIESTKKEPEGPKKMNLKNGETLHSSGSAHPQPSSRTKNTVKVSKPTPKLQDKSNFSAYQQKPVKSERIIPKPSESVIKKEVIAPQKETVTMATPDAKPSEPRLRPSQMKENRAAVPQVAKRREKSENQFKEVVNESFDDSMLKSKAMIAANHIMQTSKTFKITPSKQRGNNQPQSATPKPQPKPNIPSSEEIKTPALEPKSKTESKLNGAVVQPPPPIPSRRFEVENTEKPQSVVKSQPARTWPPPKPQDKLPSTSIDDILDDLPDSPTTISSMSQSTLESLTKDTVKESAPKSDPIKTEPVSKELKPQQNSFVKKTPPNSISFVPKSEPAIKSQSIFGPKVTKSSASSSRGKSFTIDPSKFRKSAAQPATASSDGSSNQNSGNTRTIVPGLKGTSAADTGVGGDAPKSGKRKLTVDQIKVIGGYVSLEKSCLSKDNKRKKSVTLSFSENDLETTYTYVSERSLLADESNSAKQPIKSPGFAKDSTIGKYTPKYLLSMKASELLEEEDDSSESKSQSSSIANGLDSSASTPLDATPLPDDNASGWSDTTTSSTDILF